VFTKVFAQAACQYFLAYGKKWPHDDGKARNFALQTEMKVSYDWLDRGTGICEGFVASSEDARIVVTRESDPSQLLLETSPSEDDGYEKEQDTLIVWTELYGIDMALSFQEPVGRAQIWGFVTEVLTRRQERQPLC
jgi:hypothetical protein